MEDATKELNCSEVLSLLGRTLPAWDEVTPNDLRAKRMTGITNRTYMLTAPSKTTLKPAEVFLRVISKDGGFFDRAREEKLVSFVADYGLGPRLFGTEGGYRFEEFIRNSRTLEPSEMMSPQWRRKVAMTLAKLHSLSPEFIPRDSPSELLAPTGPIVGEFLKKTAPGVTAFTEEEQAQVNEISSLILPEEVGFLSSRMMCDSSQLVLSHNDLLANNLLVIDEQRIMFVDLEYAKYNLPAFDFANYFNETMFDYSVDTAPYFRLLSDNYPSEDARKDMLLTYLMVKMYSLDEKLEATIVTEGPESEEYKKLALKPETGRALAALEEELKICTLLSHAYWILWAVVMSKNPEIPFDYIAFAYARYREYVRLKAEYFPSF
eukprot:TRINITY_DN635_c0_g1_i1.p1 TRINITY_DN635_c0_g1~~TRINITY_DN635_c0_g1_i1.p1  ORF type:complete len:378 (-),score=96.37 TRINITY_DN635_c0_g1_i1:164-1297(-)